MIPFFQTNKLADKYITKDKDIENFLKSAMLEQKVFQLTMSGLENSSITRIISIDKASKQINLEQTGEGFDVIAEPINEYPVVAEVRSDNKILRFESTLQKKQGQTKHYSIHFPLEIEKTVKRQVARYRPRNDIEINVNFCIKDDWLAGAKLTDISENGIGFIIHEKFWGNLDQDMQLPCMFNVEDVLHFSSEIKVIHTFTVFETGTKHGGAQFINLRAEEKENLKGLLKQLLHLKLVQH